VQVLAVEARADHPRVVGILVAMRERQVEDAAVGKIIGQQYFKQPALARDEDGGQAAYRFRAQPRRVYNAQATGSFGHQHHAVRQERDTPGMLQPLGQGLDPVPRRLSRNCCGHCEQQQGEDWMHGGLLSQGEAHCAPSGTSVDVS
jgi:hypothetical protein